MNNRTNRKLTESLREFLQLESSGGLILVGAAVLAVILANTPLETLYQKVLDLNLSLPKAR